MRGNLLIALVSLGLITSAQNYVSEEHPDFYFNQAIALYQTGDYTAAKHMIDEYLLLKVTPEALYYRAISAIKAEQKSGGHYVQTFIKEYPLHPLAHKAKFELGHWYFTRSNYTDALTTYASMEMNSLDKKQKEQAYFEKGYSMLQLKITAQGVEALRQANEFQGEYKHISAYYMGVMTEGEEAEQWFIQASEDEDWKIKSAVYLSQIYLKSKEYEKLQAWNDPLLSAEKTEDNKNLHFYTAESYYQQKNYRKASRYYQGGLDLNLKKPDAETLFKIGHTYYEIGEKEKAIDQLKLSGLNETATGQASAFQLGKIYTELGQFSNALNAYEIAAASDHDPVVKEEAKFLAGKISVQVGQYGQAIQKLEGFIAEFPKSDKTSEANVLLSNAYLNTSNYDLVIEHFERIKSTDPSVQRNYQQVTLIKGMQSFSDRKVEVAAQYIQKSIGAPVNKELLQQAYYWMGECQFTLGDNEGARRSYIKAIETNNAYSLPNYGLGYLEYNSNNYEEAKRRFNIYKRLAPSGHQFYNDASLRIADCDYALKNYDVALAGYNSLAGTKVAQDYIYYQIGLIHQLNGRVPQAIAGFENVLKMPKSSYRDNALFQTAQTYMEDANFDMAIKGFTSYINQYSNENLAPYARLKRGQCYYNTQALESSKDDYVFVLDNHINHPASQDALLGIQELQKQGISIDFDRYMLAYSTAHPDDSSLESIEFEQAKTLYFNGDYQQAISKFKTLLSKNSESAFKEDIIYYLGDSNERVGALAEANQYYEQIIAMAPSKYLNRVLDKRGKLLLTTGQGTKAIQNYSMLQTQASNRKESYLATEGLMKSYFLTKEYQKCIEQGRSITTATWKPSNAENEASLIIGKSLVYLGDSSSAVDEFLNVINGGADELGAEAKYRIAEVYYHQKKYNTSLESLFQLNQKYGAYQKWIGESFLLIADNYVGLDELLQAKATLNSLLDNFPDPGIKDRARVKLTSIEKSQLVESEADTLR